MPKQCLSIPIIAYFIFGIAVNTFAKKYEVKVTQEAIDILIDEGVLATGSGVTMFDIQQAIVTKEEQGEVTSSNNTQLDALGDNQIGTTRIVNGENRSSGSGVGIGQWVGTFSGSADFFRTGSGFEVLHTTFFSGALSASAFEVGCLGSVDYGRVFIGAPDDITHTSSLGTTPAGQGLIPMSFSGSFVGNGSGLTNLTLPNNLLSGSAQIATEISGAFISPSSSFSTRVTTLETNNTGTNTGDQDLSGLALKTAVSGAFTEASGGFSTRITNLKTDSGSFSTRVTSLEEGGAGSGFTAAGISGSFGAPSASFSTRVTSLEASSGLTPGIISGSAQIATEISGAFVAPSSSFSTRVTTLETNNTGTNTGDQDLSGLALKTAVSGAFVAPSASFSTRVTTLESAGGGGIFTDSNGFKVTTNNLIVSKSAAGALTSSLSVQGSGSTIFDVKGNAGQLLEVQDGLDGVLMSVNDISGIPILTVSSSGNIIIPNSSRLIGTASVALSVPGATSAFPFTGNARIDGALDVTGSGDDIFKVRSKSGSLFSVDDGLDGILMSVNDISGLPLFEVDSSGNIIF